MRPPLIIRQLWAKRPVNSTTVAGATSLHSKNKLYSVPAFRIKIEAGMFTGLRVWVIIVSQSLSLSLSLTVEKGKQNSILISFTCTNFILHAHYCKSVHTYLLLHFVLRSRVFYVSVKQWNLWEQWQIKYASIYNFMILQEFAEMHSSAFIPQNVQYIVGTLNNINIKLKSKSSQQFLK